MRVAANALAESARRNGQVLDLVAGIPTGYARLSCNRSEANDYRDGCGAVVPAAWDKWNADAAFGYPSDPVRIGEPGRTAWAKLKWKY